VAICSSPSLPSNLIEAIHSARPSAVLQKRNGPLSNQSTPNTPLSRLCDKIGIPYPMFWGFVGRRWRRTRLPLPVSQ
jgi:hypothetical protein